MDPSAAPAAEGDFGLPRTRGDGPEWRRGLDGLARASPHTRGWTRRDSQPAEHGEGFPAHAGMDRRRRVPRVPRAGLPRTRGDGPELLILGPIVASAPPHTRGWTVRRHPVPEWQGGSPAHAGMDPSWTASPPGSRWLPRTRGDGPPTDPTATPNAVAPPHTRGWTPLTADRVDDDVGSPAHAGMDPGHCDAGAPGVGLPRTRGDGPRERGIYADVLGAPPHTRGWTRSDAGGRYRRPGSPAHAGMDP